MMEGERKGSKASEKARRKTTHHFCSAEVEAKGRGPATAEVEEEVMVAATAAVEGETVEVVDGAAGFFPRLFVRIYVWSVRGRGIRPGRMSRGCERRKGSGKEGTDDGERSAASAPLL